MSCADPTPLPSPLLQLPLGVLQQIVERLPPDDQQAVTLACKQVRSIVLATVVNQLSISQHTMNPLPPNLSNLPAAFTAVHHLTLDARSNLPSHTVPFLQSFQQHYGGVLSALTSLTIQFDSRKSYKAEQLAQLLGSCHSLALLTVTSTDECDMYDREPIDITVKEQTPGAGLHHLSHCFLHCNQPMHLHLLSCGPFRQHISSFSCDHYGFDSFDSTSLTQALHLLNVDGALAGGTPSSAAGDVLWTNLPALQDLSFLLAKPNTLPPLLKLTTLTHLHLGISPITRDAEQLNQLLRHSIPSLLLLKSLDLDAYSTYAANATMPPSWSCLQHLTNLQLRGIDLASDSGVWHLTHLESLCLVDCSLAPALGLHSLLGLNHLRLRDVASEHMHTAGAPFLPPCLTCISLTAQQDAAPVVDGWLAGMCSLAGTLQHMELSCEALLEASFGLVTRLTSLQQLELSYRSPDDAAINPHALSSMTRLTSLSLEDRFEDYLGKDITTDMLPLTLDLQGMTCLQQLHLRGRLSLASISGVPSSLTHLKSPLIPGDDGVMILPHSLRHCRSLSTLAVDTSYIRPGIVCDPSHTLVHLTSLQSLHLISLHPSVPAAMSPMPLLRYLHLSLANIGASIPPPAWLQHLNRLKSLTLRGFAAHPTSLPSTLTQLELSL